MKILIICLLLFSGVLLWAYGPAMNIFTDYTFRNEKMRVKATFLLIVATLAVPLQAGIVALLFPIAQWILIGIGLIFLFISIIITEYLPLGISYAPGMTWNEYVEMCSRNKAFLDRIPGEEDPFCRPTLMITYKRRHISGKYRKQLAYNEFAVELADGKKLEQIKFSDIRPSFMKFAKFHVEYLEEQFEKEGR